MSPRTPRLRTPRRVFSIAAVAASVMLCLAACTPVPAVPPETSAPPAGIDWTPCEDDLECADVTVPLDWGDPDGEQIELAVLRHPASDPDRRIGTLFFNPGGPGESGAGAVAQFADEFDAWGDGRFDVVGWDPRGTNGSSPISCFDDASALADFWTGVTLPVTDAESEAYAEVTTSLVERCRESMGDLLSHVSAGATARDLDRLRELVGDDQLTYVGLSYGTLIGQTYANLYPDRVRAMVLDGVVDAVAFTASAEDRVVAGVASVGEVFEQFLTLCDEAGATGCALAAHGEPARDRVDRLLAASRAGGAGAVPYNDVLGTILGALAAPAAWTGLAESLDAAVDGDASGVAASGSARSTPDFAAALTVGAAISCVDGPADRDIDAWPSVVGDLVELSPLAGSFQGWWQWAPCASDWPADPHRYDGPWDAETENPLLLIGNRYDPNTPYANAVITEDRLGDAVLLTLEGYGHISLSDPSECIAAARTRYLVDLEVPAAGTRCAPDSAPFAQ